MAGSAIPRPWPWDRLTFNPLPPRQALQLARDRTSSPVPIPSKANSSARLGQALYSTQTSAWPQVAAQSSDVSLAFGGNRPPLLQGPGTRHIPQRQHHQDLSHGLRWRHQLLTSGCPSLPSAFQFSLCSTCSHPLASLSLPPLISHLSGT